ncbi:MAG: hypothetical protein A3F17_03060 [Gammaproteobacteria bacterium RIFCSPHIGHO2_12_FULL_41_15]|nr:MAG: hypothetical protein A3F17_03060 [Gammaproteobacteria bacterium RIFCSPHIGHO2_12_FULL_41_15]
MLHRIAVIPFLLAFSFSAYALNIDIKQCTEAQQKGGQTGLVTAIKAIDAGCDAANYFENAFGKAPPVTDPKGLAAYLSLKASVKIACTGALAIASGVCEYCSKNTNNCIQCGNYMRGNYGGADLDTRFKICFNTWTGVLQAALPAAPATQ